MFVTVVILLFYLPLIQGQINDLDQVIEESQEDFKLFRDRIRQFNKDLFEFSQLENRVNQYQGIAEGQRDRAQTWVRITFYSLLLTWFALATLSAIAFEIGSTHFISLIISVILFGATLRAPKKYSPRDRIYFDEDWVLVAILAGIGLILLSFGLSTNQEAVSSVICLPRFNTTAVC
jgi:hypothetical protein